MAQMHTLRPMALKARLEARAIELQEQRRQIVADIITQIEKNELDRALVDLFLLNFVGPYTMSKLREMGLADATGLTLAGRARLVWLWDQHQPANETHKNLFRQDGQD